jgi:release factor glutamine methyltransferase
VTYRQFLAARAAELAAADGESDTPFLDACLVLSHALGTTRTKLLARFPETLYPADIPASFEEGWARRLAGESVAYIIGAKEFFGREFLVDRRVLVPRPDTETLVAAALELGDAMAPGGSPDPRGGGAAPRPLRVHDVCTGSGAVAVSLAAERPGWRVSASDLSRDALDVAAANAARLLPADAPPLTLCRADLLEGLAGPFDLITANPPYVPSGETAALLARGWREPVLALDGGPDGLALMPRLIGQAFRALASGGFLLIESDALQSPDIRGMFLKEGFGDVRVWKDLAGLDRITGAKKP